MTSLSSERYSLTFVPMDARFPVTSNLFCCYCGEMLPTRGLPICGETYAIRCTHCDKVLKVTNIVRVHDWEVNRG